MKLGVSYNVFDGEELLEGSIKCIRSEVDYISVIYQTISNYKNFCSPELEPLLERLKSEGLIDELVHFKTDLNDHPPCNEVNKRRLGLELSLKQGCTHHMSMDTDEYYLLDDFKRLKKEMIDGDYDSSACTYITYYKSSNYRLQHIDTTYVSLIYKIRPNITYILGNKFPVKIDPTRSMNEGKCRIFEPNELVMHHLSYVRKNINSKVYNSSSKVLYEKYIDNFLEHFNKWQPGEKGITVGMVVPSATIVETEDLFNIKF